MGFHCPERATTGDFLTSLTSPNERRAREGFESRVPRTPDEFAARWKDSTDRAQLLNEIAAFEQQYPIGQEQIQKFVQSRKAEQAKHTYANEGHFSRTGLTMLQTSSITIHDLSTHAGKAVCHSWFPETAR